MELAKPLLILPIPDVDDPIGPSCSKRVVLTVKGDGVDWVDFLDSCNVPGVQKKGKT